MKDILKQQRELCHKEWRAFYAGSEEDPYPFVIGDAILNAPEPTEIMTAHIHQLLIDLDSFLTDEHPIKHNNSYKYLKSKI